MQEEVESRIAVIMTNCSKLTASTLAKALGKVLAGAKQKHDVKTARKAAEKANGPRGQMTVKELAAKDKGMQSIEVNDGNIGAFSRVARKYGIDFAPFKVKGEDKFIVFFKAPDADAMTAAFSEYTRRQVKAASRPSVLKALAQIKSLIKAPVMNRTKKKERER